MTQTPLQSALQHLEPVAINIAAKAETRAREHHLPPISVYRWWARRTEAVNGSLLDAVIAERGGSDPMIIADPFVGGGVIPLAALKRGHRIYAQDLNPWVTQGLQAMLTMPDPAALAGALDRLRKAAARLTTRAYATRFDDGETAEISQAIRVAVAPCSACDRRHRLFPHALVTQLRRRETGRAEAILACRCGHLFHGDGRLKHDCPVCGRMVDPAEVYQPNRRVTCPHCDAEETLEKRAVEGPWDWELVLVERVGVIRRELGFPTLDEIGQAGADQWKPRRRLGRIPVASETRVLLRHGFSSWSDLYPRRQRHVLEALLRLAPQVAASPQEALALEMAILGSAEMAGHLSRWDRFYLKSYEAMASHRFNLTTLAVEPNVLGAGLHGRGTVARRVKLFQSAANWLSRHQIEPKVEALSASRSRIPADKLGQVTVVSGSSERLLLSDGSVDLVLTDPPYHDDVQYHELSLPLRAWAKLARGRAGGEAVAIPHRTALSSHRAYRSVLERIFRELHRVLKPDGRLLFSYANREPVAWVNLFAALRTAGLRPLGFAIVHSENESDHAKRSSRACNLDLILELVRRDAQIGAQWRAQPLLGTEEERYLLAVGEAFLRSGDIVDDWGETLLKRLRQQAFVKDIEPSGAGAKDAAAKGPQAAIEQVA